MMQDLIHAYLRAVCRSHCRLSYDPDKDLIPIALAAAGRWRWLFRSKAPYSTLQEFLTALKAKLKMTFASAGIALPVTSRVSSSNCNSTTI
jgi:hypothetical protein